MSRTLRLPGPETEAAVTDHALERYGQHVRPHLYGYPDELMADLRRLVRTCGKMSPRAPKWVRENRDGGGITEQAEDWVLCGDIALVVKASGGSCPLAVTTVLTKGGISEAARSTRNQRRSRRTHARRKRKHLDHLLPRDAAAGARRLPSTDPGE